MSTLLSKSLRPPKSLGLASVLGATTLAAGLVVGASAFTPANAASFNFSGSGAGGRSASATFDTTTGMVTLTNTGGEVSRPNQVLTAIFFNLSDNPALTPVSANLDGSTVFYGSQPATGNVGGEWAYNSDFNVDGARYGISSVGLGLFGPNDRFDTTQNLQGPKSPNGLQYGIVSASDNLTQGNKKVTGGTPKNPVALIQDHVKFNLAGFGPDTTVSSVFFQYGTDLSEPRIPGQPQPIPEPASMLGIMAFGALGGGKLLKRRKQQAAQG